MCDIEIIEIFIEQYNIFQKMNKRQTSKGLVLYEEVLQKNFEIIETFLNKFPMIFKKQDYFEDSIKKINDRLSKQEQQNDKIREQVQLNTAMLDKKINNVKDHSSRNSRSSVRVSQQIIPLQERRNSIFRISSAFKEPKQNSSAYFSKEKAELLSQMQKKQQQSLRRVQQIEYNMDRMKQKMNFLSVMNGKIEEKIDNLFQSKVDKNQFDQLALEYEKKFETVIKKLVQDKYFLGGKLIDKKVSIMESNLSKFIENLTINVKKEMLQQIQKKAGLSQFKGQLGQIKGVIEKMVDQSVESFASKQQTKKVLTLFQKKFIKFQLVIEQLLSETMKGSPQEQVMQCMSLGVRKDRQKDTVMNSFGRKKKN